MNAAPDTAEKEPVIERIDSILLHRSETNPRTHFSTEGLDEMRDSIRQHGIIEPLLGRPSKVHAGKVEIVAGERRYRGHQSLMAHLDELLKQTDTPAEKRREWAELRELRSKLPVIVLDLDDKTVLERQLIENLQRKALTAVEEGRAYARMKDEHGYTAAEIAKRIGVTKRNVEDKLKLVRAPIELLNALEAGEVGEIQTMLVAGIPDAKLRDQAAKIVLKGYHDFRIEETRPLTVKQTRAMIRTSFMVSLKGAEWNLDDATLLPEAGPCSTCIYLARNSPDPEIQAELNTKKGGSGIESLTCMNPACHTDKLGQRWKQMQADAKKQGVKVLSATEVKDVLYDNGLVRGDADYVDLASKPSLPGVYDNSKTPTYGDMVEKADAKPDLFLCRTSDGTIKKLVKKALAQELVKTMKAKGKLKGKPEPTDSEKKEKAKAALEQKVKARERIETLETVYRKLTKVGFGIEERKAMLEMMLMHAGMDGSKIMAAWLKVQPDEPKKGHNMHQGCYQTALLKHITEQGHGAADIEALTVVAFLSKFIGQGWSNDYFMKPLLTVYGIDPKEIHKQASDQVKAEQAAVDAKKKAKKEGPDRKVTSKSKSASIAKNDQLTAADERTRDKLTKGSLVEPLAKDGPIMSAGKRSGPTGKTALRIFATKHPALKPAMSVPPAPAPEPQSSSRLKMWLDDPKEGTSKPKKKRIASPERKAKAAARVKALRDKKKAAK